MDAKTKTVLTYAAIGGGLLMVYLWLRSSGTWAQWFGSNEFTDQAALLNYCHTCDPSQSVVFIDASGARHSATCAQWLAANPQITRAAESAAKEVSLAGSNPTLAAQLRDAAIASPILGVDSASVDQWNYLLREIDASAPIINDPEAVGAVRGVSDVMTAAQYVELRAGLLGRREAAAVRETKPDAGNPYKDGWVN